MGKARVAGFQSLLSTYLIRNLTNRYQDIDLFAILLRTTARLRIDL
jgi:hypothetical protein